MILNQKRSLCLALAFVFASAGISPENAGTVSVPQLTAAQIVDQMQRHNQARVDALKHLKSTRHYEVEYKGFPTALTAKTEVEYSFDAATGKSFRIVSESGSKFLLEKVIRRAIDSEKEASQEKSSSALTTANYKFRLAWIESLVGRPAYVLEVEPVVASKFLYRGKVWVDASDFALVKIDAAPAKSPSFWIARTTIRQSFVKTGDFWLPEKNRSETKVRIGGTAVFTIDYGTYQIESNRLQ
jgi:hypothetical protein